MPYILCIILCAYPLYAGNHSAPLQKEQAYVQELKQLFTICSSGNAEGCFDLAYIYSNLPGRSNTASTLFFYTKACQYGDALACYLLASSYQNGHYGAVISRSKALHFYKRGCQLKDIDSCLEYESLKKQ
jgi:TPR repeat protein